jgi:hypothetical protein
MSPLPQDGVGDSVEAATDETNHETNQREEYLSDSQKVATD